MFWKDGKASAEPGSRSLLMCLRTARRPEYLEECEQRGEKYKMSSESLGEGGRSQGLTGHCRDFGFSPKGGWESLEDSEQRNSMI